MPASRRPKSSERSTRPDACSSASPCLPLPVIWQLSMTRWATRRRSSRPCASSASQRLAPSKTSPVSSICSACSAVQQMAVAAIEMREAPGTPESRTRARQGQVGDDIVSRRQEHRRVAVAGLGKHPGEGLALVVRCVRLHAKLRGVDRAARCRLCQGLAQRKTEHGKAGRSLQQRSSVQHRHIPCDRPANRRNHASRRGLRSAIVRPMTGLGKWLVQSPKRA